MNTIGIFNEERFPDEFGEPGSLVSRRLNQFSGPAGTSIKELVTRGNDGRWSCRSGLARWNGTAR